MNVSQSVWHGGLAHRWHRIVRVCSSYRPGSANRRGAAVCEPTPLGLLHHRPGWATGKSGSQYLKLRLSEETRQVRRSSSLASASAPRSSDRCVAGSTLAVVARHLKRRQAGSELASAGCRCRLRRRSATFVPGRSSRRVGHRCRRGFLRATSSRERRTPRAPAVYLHQVPTVLPE